MSDTNNTRWSRSIRALLKRHNLSTQTAVAKAGQAISSATLEGWLGGICPKSPDEPYAFLSHFPADEARICLKAGGYPMPNMLDAQYQDIIKDVESSLDAYKWLSDAGKQQIIDFIKEVTAKQKNNT